MKNTDFVHIFEFVTSINCFSDCHVKYKYFVQKNFDNKNFFITYNEDFIKIDKIYLWYCNVFVFNDKLRIETYFQSLTNFIDMEINPKNILRCKRFLEQRGIYLSHCLLKFKYSNDIINNVDNPFDKINYRGMYNELNYDIMSQFGKIE